MKEYISISSRVRLARNLADIPFPSRATQKNAATVEQAARLAAKACFEGSCYSLRDLDGEEIRYLVERHLISPALASASFGSVIISSDKHRSVMLMEEDHIRAQSFRTGSDLSQCFEEVKEYDLALRGRCTLAYDKKLGYLTACPTNVGTGMRASVMLFLPGITLMQRLDVLEEELKNAGLTLRGALGEGSKGDGFRYQISNAISIGISEETILNRVSSAVERIAEIEEEHLLAYYKQNTLRVEDAVCRAQAILSSARVLSQKEAEGLLVERKIGCMLGLIDPNGVREDELILMTKPISLVRLTRCEDSPFSRDVARAEMIRKIINGKEE